MYGQDKPHSWTGPVAPWERLKEMAQHMGTAMPGSPDMNLFTRTLRSGMARTARGARLLALDALRGPDSHLLKAGWFESRTSRASVDAAGAPLPWYTYAAMQFMEPRLNTTMKVFEYGSGNSTLWWSSRVSCVTSCEHDREWFDRVSQSLPANVEYELASGEDYAQRIRRHRARFDIVVIDGRDRVACAMASLDALTPDGVVIWDNSDRPDDSEGYAFLAANDMRRLDFHGMGPINTYAWCTSIFYRRDNCLSI